MPIGAPIALPVGPPDDDIVYLTVAPLLAFECAAAARDCCRVARSFPLHAYELTPFQGCS
jgi:hypothetical protein